MGGASADRITDKVSVEELAIGDKAMCRWKDGSPHLADILSIGTDRKQFYVHYVDFNRRLDEWISADRVDMALTCQMAAAAAAGGTAAGGMPAAASAAAAEDAGAALASAHDGTPVGGEVDGPATAASRKLTRNQKRRIEEITNPHGLDDFDAQTVELERDHHDEPIRVKNVEQIVIGKYEIDTWYFSPYPEEYVKDSKKLHLCEFCLKYMKRARTLERHKAKCALRHPPGDEIYRDSDLKISVFEVDGKKQKIYCQNLCLLSKLFLDHKTLYYDVEPFLFYVVCEIDDYGAHTVGYFSKEKLSLENYNLACIMTLPPYQRKGYGKFMISMSYALSRKEDKVGTPERPLSDLGLVSYRSYWKGILLDVLSRHKSSVSIRELARITAIRPDDIISTLQHMNMIKYWKGQHILSVSPRLIEENLKRQSNSQPALTVDMDKLHWTPYVLPPGISAPQQI